MTSNDGATRLARRLRELRQSVKLTQAQLATVFSAEEAVTGPTISTWESETNPKTPTPARLAAYARFFAVPRSLEGDAHLPPLAELTEEESEQVHELEATLLGLLEGGSAGVGSTFAFDSGPVTIVCPEAPSSALGPLAKTSDPNFSKLQQYADLDALVEMHGHIRACNPELDVFHTIPSEVEADGLSSHLVLIGGIGWNSVTRRIQNALKQVPITQVEDSEIATGEIFTDGGGRRFLPVWEDESGEQRHLPRWEDESGEPEMVEDVAFLARLPNPFNRKRTVTICNGIHSRGVLGAVRCLTDKRVRDANERYLAERFPEGRFALLMRVPVVGGKVMSPDLPNPEHRLYEWPNEGSAG